MQHFFFQLAATWTALLVRLATVLENLLSSIPALFAPSRPPKIRQHTKKKSQLLKCATNAVVTRPADRRSRRRRRHKNGHVQRSRPRPLGAVKTRVCKLFFALIPLPSSLLKSSAPQ